MSYRPSGSYRRFGTIQLAVAGVTASSSYALRISDLKHQSLELVAMLTCLIVAALSQAAPILIVESTPRTRSQVCMTLAYKAVPIVFAFRFKMCVFFSAGSFFFELLACFASAWIHQDFFPLHYIGIMAMLHAVYLAISQQQHISLRALYDTEEQCKAKKNAAESLAQQLQKEKHATETLLAQLQEEQAASEAILVQLRDEQATLASLLGMVCDASLWLSTDGDVVVHSNQRLDALVGCSMTGIQLSSIIVESERERFTAALEIAASSTVYLLHTAIRRPGSCAKVDIDMFIVRRKQSGPTDSSLGYLLGLRLPGAVDDAHRIEPWHDQADALPISTGVSSTRAFTMSSVLGDFESEPAFRTVQRFGTDGVAKFRGLPVLEPFQESAPYLAHCAESVIVDLAGAMNFRVDACCAWHSALNRLLDVLTDVAQWHGCEEAWRPPAAWQCANCSALIPPELPADRCWICTEPTDQEVT